jgi:ATP-dependent exoDNAse (exonuclease V) alpha subunit
MIPHLYRYLIQGQVLTDTWAGTVHLIPQIDLSSAEEELAFILTRQQFPMRLCFVMMINKSQGQSLQTVGVDLRTAVFSHDQLYSSILYN